MQTHPGGTLIPARIRADSAPKLPTYRPDHPRSQCQERRLAASFGVQQRRFPFLPRQISFMNGLAIGIPAFFLALTQYRPLPHGVPSQIPPVLCACSTHRCRVSVLAECVRAASVPPCR